MPKAKRSVVLTGAGISAQKGADVFLVVGTSGLVQGAASLPLVSMEQGAQLIEINPEPTPLTPRAHASLRGGAAGVWLPRLV